MREAPAVSIRCRAAVGALLIDVDFTLTRAWTVLFGPSGSGKSSLLRLAAGLWMPKDASVHIGEHDVTTVPPHRRRVGMVAQQPALFPHLDVLRNVRFGCRHHPGCIDFVAELLDRMELQPLQHARIAQLSGGERQRVALARALAASPRLLLLDEAFTGMHREQRAKLLEDVRTRYAHDGIPVLSVTHDIAEAADADEVLRMVDGRIIAQGRPEDVLAAERTALLRQLG